MRMQLELERRRQSTRIMAAVQESLATKLKEKDEELQRIEKLNFILEQRARKLIRETEIWKQMAQTNEAEVNNLRNSIEQVMAQVSEDNRNNKGNAEYTESSCSNAYNPMEEEERTDEAVMKKRMCSNCGIRGPVVLLLPCRHLCVCTICGSTLQNCPVCFSGINVTVRVNFS